MTCWGQKRQVNKADGHVRFTSDRVGLAALSFVRREHNSQWSAVYLHRGCVSTSWMHKNAQSVYAAIRG
jgi:hypothetical protein